MGGPERRSRVISPAEKRIVAYHESGHAVLRKTCPTPIRSTRSASSRAARPPATCLSFPEEDRGLVSKTWFMDFVVIALGGRVAEELIFNEITNGARDDLDKMTQIARQMVTRYGMSDALGPMVYGRKEETRLPRPRAI